MGHSMAYSAIMRMEKWENIKFDSTTLIDALYAYPQVFAKIAKDYNRFGKFTSYGLFNRRLEKNSTYNNNVYLRNLLKRAKLNVNYSSSINADLSDGRDPSIVVLREKRKKKEEKGYHPIPTPDGEILVHQNISRYVFDRFLIQNKLLTQEQVYGKSD